MCFILGVRWFSYWLKLESKIWGRHHISDSFASGENPGSKKVKEIVFSSYV